MRRKSVITGLAAAVMSMGALSACGGSDDDSTAASGASAATTTTSSGAAAAGGKIDSSKPAVVLALNSLKIQTVDLLTPYEAGAKAAAAVINGKGGIGGRKVEVFTCNTMYQPATVAACARKSIAAKATAAFGCEPSWPIAGLPIMAKAKIPSFNCPNAAPDWTNPWSFGLTGGTNGDNRAFANWICTRDDIKSVATFVQDIPISHTATPAAMDPVLKGCGKTIKYFYYPITGADLTPDVSKVAATKPDFVLAQGGGALAIQVFKLFSQAGIPASKMGISGNALSKKQVLDPAGATMDGVYSAINTQSWDNTSDADVAEYLKAMAASSPDVDAQDVNPETAYMQVMAMYAASKNIKGDITGQSLADYMNKANNVPIPTSRSILNPGPTGYAQIKQPYDQMVQWKDGKLNVLTENTDQGWIKGY
jgi:branched-chain amino acid transport system substrate-binding protein